jgi:hypothetical protein
MPIIPSIKLHRELDKLDFKLIPTGIGSKASLSHGGKGDAVFGLKLLVNVLFLHVHTLQDRVLHFIFEAAIIRIGKSDLFFSTGNLIIPPIWCCAID